MNIFDSTGVHTFPVQHSALEKLLTYRRQFVRLSLLKVYLLLAYECRSYLNPFTGQTVIRQTRYTEADICTATGVNDPKTLRVCRKILKRMDLIACQRGGDHRKFEYQVLDVRTGEPFDTEGYEKGSSGGYFRVPECFLTSKLFREDSGICTAHYLTLLAYANRTHTALLPLGVGELAKESHSSRHTSSKALGILSSGPHPFVRVGRGEAEILDPISSRSLEKRPKRDDWPLYLNDDGRPAASVEVFSRKHFEMFYSHHFPGLDIAHDQCCVHCPFHSDATASMSLDLQTGWFNCHACGTSGKKMISFEMALQRKADVPVDKFKAGKAVGKITGVKVYSRPKRPVEVPPRFTYYEADRITLRYQIRRYDDGSARPYRPLNEEGTRWAIGLGTIKRIPYHLDELIPAETVILTEGERKCDLVHELGLVDNDGAAVAVTATGGNTSWRHDLYVGHFKGKRVVILRDSDEGGRRYAELVARSLHDAGIPHKVVHFDEHGGSVRHFLEKFPGEAPHELVRHLGCDWEARDALVRHLECDWIPSQQALDVAQDLAGV